MRILKITAATLLFCIFAASALAADTAPVTDVNRVIDSFIQRERDLVRVMSAFHPVVETYYQSVRADAELGSVPVTDEYFLGRLSAAGGLKETLFVDVRDSSKRLRLARSFFHTVEILPIGFSSMIFVDVDSFDRNHYDFKFLRREFLGEVRCLVFEVAPGPKAGRGRFLGRIWVDDRDYNIVRFNGTFTDPPRGNVYFHMDSWRANVQPGMWLPSHVYAEESDLKLIGQPVRFKAQTRLWGYNLSRAGRQQGFTDLMVDAPEPVKDETRAANEASPVTSARAWQTEAEENVVERLEQAGLLAARSDVDTILSTVVNNLQITNNLDLGEVRCRVLLTTPLESFTVGRTIVLSRGLIDVLPDEASLAMVLSHELAHIALGHPLDTKYAFSDRMVFADEKAFQTLRFQRTDVQEREADQKAVQLLKNSPYSGKLQTAGLFLRALRANAQALPNLIAAQLGNGLVEQQNKTLRMSELMNGAPELQPKRVDQIPALPLGARIKLDPWSDKVEMSKAKAVALVSAREKMVFEVTPIIPHLARLGDAVAQRPVATVEAGK